MRKRAQGPMVMTPRRSCWGERGGFVSGERDWGWGGRDVGLRRSG